MLLRIRKWRTYLALSLLATLVYYAFHIYIVRDPPHFMQFYTSRRTLEHYNGFNFDRENWTVRMLTEGSLNVESKRLLNSLISEDGVVKRIVFTNGSELNLGCSNITHKCTEETHFDHRHNI